jgi:hypothetical protein
METTILKTVEISIPEQYVSAIRALVKSMGGNVRVRKEKKCGLDKAIDEVKEGKVSKAYTNVEELWKDLMS